MEKENRRKFFMDFAAQNGFDPLKPENWYSQQRQRIVELPVFPITFSSLIISIYLLLFIYLGGVRSSFLLQ